MACFRFSILLFLLLPLSVFAQSAESQKDSTGVTKLDEVVLVGESKVMSLSKKLFRVEVIGREQIRQLAGNTLADVLNQNLNITVMPDASTGRSTISMFGLDGQYVKILLDGIPLASDNGLGNDIDITQINLEDVERIEIVEGSMGVLYGDNAVAGVINIVSKRGVNDTKWSIRTSLQEESVGSEYSWFDQGRHIQNLRLDRRLGQDGQVSFGASRNDYGGFYNDYKGQDYVNIQDGTVVNDGLRGMEWSPKLQLTAFVDFRQKIKKHNLYFKSQYFDEDLAIYDHDVIGRLNANGEPNPTATDQQFDTHRWVNNLSLFGTLGSSATYNLALSYQDQKRYYKAYSYNILQKGIEAVTADRLNQSSKILYSKATISNIFERSEWFNLLLGYEFAHQKGFDAIASGAYSENLVENTLENYDLFASADLLLGKTISFYPGVRLTNNSQFGNRLIWSLSSTYDLGNRLKLKAILGSAFRAPNFEELFYYFVDSNHNVQGNQDLLPEDGISIFVDLDKKWAIGQGNGLFSTALKAYHFNIDDKIAFVADDSGDTPLFTYKNVDQQKILGFSINNGIRLKQLAFGLGATYLGEAITLDASQNTGNSDYVWSLGLNSNISYDLPKLKASLSAQLKYTGVSQTIATSDDDGVVLDRTDPFTWLDTSVHFDLTPNIDLTMGARNVLDVVTVKASDVSSGTHGTTGTDSRLFGNGRSYFLKLSYLLTFN
ncbi:TonB-dependent receptor plug domain-containing protein [Pseudozobellia thermophila]|uniref:Outer membrane receptor for ferrienterochelin and colicins n=1 Tax=Pseudozobellia thermophila TaxID=192903 RepID=A0A1M6B356_9FLAO|nr:TonB-dependent receptor [Pseudozobellia thermophila]SHI43182.1 outer membrane receptor for ferrienterochelin and colicins [Pseudozobellia thermophila]